MRAAGLPSARDVASCMYLAYGRLLFCVSDRCNNDLQGALLTACCVVIACEGEAAGDDEAPEQEGQRVVRLQGGGQCQGATATVAVAVAKAPGTMRLALSTEHESDWREADMRSSLSLALVSAVADQNLNQCQVETVERKEPPQCVCVLLAEAFFNQPFITFLHPSLTAWRQQQR